MTLSQESTPTQTPTRGPPPGSSRLRMKPTTGGDGPVDGAWWPATDELAGALPDLLAQLASQLLPILHISYQPRGWRAGVPRRLLRGMRGVRLDGDRYQPADTIDLIGRGPRLVLLVVPASTHPGVAESILRAAADSRDLSTTGELLALGTQIMNEHDYLSAQHDWEYEGGSVVRAAANA
jgi:hypothetical protein